MTNAIKIGKGWAWTIVDTNGSEALCHWAEPARDRLVGNRPSTESKAVHVAIVPMRDWRKIQRAFQVAESSRLRRPRQQVIQKNK